MKYVLVKPVVAEEKSEEEELLRKKITEHLPPSCPYKEILDAVWQVPNRKQRVKALYSLLYLVTTPNDLS